MNGYFVPLHVQYNSMMKSNLFFQGITKFLLGVIILGLLIFLPAGCILAKIAKSRIENFSNNF